jgi:hypothetical protein
MAGEIDIADAEARALEHRVQSAEKLMGDMLKDEKLFHRGSIAAVILVGCNYNLCRGNLKRQ